MPSSLWTPQGPKTIDKHRQTMSRGSLQTISRMHQVNAELGDIEVRCLRCGQSFQGENNDSAPTLFIECGCRRIEFHK